MTQPGGVYCKRCWDFYRWRILELRNQIADDRIISRFIITRFEQIPPVYTPEQRAQARNSGQTYCAKCYNLDVTVVTHENQASILASLSTSINYDWTETLLINILLRFTTCLFQSSFAFQSFRLLLSTFGLHNVSTVLLHHSRTTPTSLTLRTSTCFNWEFANYLS